MLDRRQFLLHSALAGAALTILPAGAFAAANAGGAQRPRLVVVILRGGLDGLHAVPPLGDADYARLRGEVAHHASGEGAALPLDGYFGLHPLLPTFAQSYQEKQLVVLQAVATSYRGRSHFDAQDMLESGVAVPHGRGEGWLNQALVGVNSGAKDRGIALSATLPLVLRGPAPVSNWSPSTRPSPDEGFLARVERLYAADPALAQALVRAKEVNALADDGGMSEMKGGGQSVVPLARAAAQFLSDDAGPSAAVLDFGGWDSHSGAFNPQGALSRSLRQLDAGMSALREGLGPVWAHTTVLVMTEFGRTAKPNGTGGTDHGTATCAFVMGGAVKGGRVQADWPGLANNKLFEGRDLAATTDLRAVAKGLLIEHLRVPASVVEAQAFPDTAAVKPIFGWV